MYLLYLLLFGFIFLKTQPNRKNVIYLTFHFLLLCLVPFFSFSFKGLALLTLLFGMIRLNPKFKILNRNWPIFECFTLYVVFTNMDQMPLGKIKALSVLEYFSNQSNLFYTCHVALLSILLYQVFSRFSLWYRAVKQKSNFTILLTLYVGSLFWIFYLNFQKPVWIACCLLLYCISITIQSAKLKRATHVLISMCWVFTAAVSVINVHNQNQRQSMRNAVKIWANHENYTMDKTFESWVNRIKNDSTLANLIAFLPQSDATLQNRIRSHLQLTRAVPYVQYAIFSKDGQVLVKANHPWLNRLQHTDLIQHKMAPKGSGQSHFYKSANDSCFYFIEFYVNAQYKFKLYYNPEQFNSLRDTYTALTSKDSIENLLFNTAIIKSAYYNSSGYLLGTENLLPQAFKTKYTCTLQSGSKWVFYELYSNFENVFFLVLSILLCAVGVFFVLQLLYRGKTLYNAIKASLWHQNVWVATVLITLFSAVLLLLVYYQIQISFETSQERQGIQLNNAIVQEFKSEFSQASVFDKAQVPLWSQVCSDLQLRYSTPILLYDSSGKYIKMQTLSSHVKNSFFPGKINPNLLTNVDAGFVLNTQLYPVFISNCRFIPDGSHIYIATLNVKDFAYQKQIKAHIGNRCIHIFIVTLLLCILLSSLINYQLTKPLRQLRQQLPLLSVEHTNSKIHIRGSGDLAQLIGAYNLLIDRLENNIEVLKLKEQSKAWKELALQVAHDIRNPLTPLKLNLQYLIQLQERDAQNFTLYFKAQAQQLVQQLDHINAMVQRFSDFSNAEPLKLQPVPLAELITTALAIVPNHVKVIWTKQLKLPVQAEPQSVLRVLNNVLHNAIAAMDAVNEPMLEIVMYVTPQNNLALELIDNGKGLSIEQQQQLFKFRFSSKTSGSGLGLMVSKELMVSMGGDLEYFKPPTLRTGFRLLFKV